MTRSRTVRELSRRRPALAPAAAAVLLAVAGAVVASSVWAADPPRRGSARFLPVESAISLPPIHSFEIARGAGEQAVAVPGRAGTQPAGPDLAWVVRREIPRLWSTTLNDREELTDLRVSIEVVSADGRRGAVSHEESGAVAARVAATPTVGREALASGGTRVVEGGGVLEFDLREVRLAGRYRGTLVITIERF